jgi:hypothetical protein
MFPIDKNLNKNRSYEITGHYQLPFPYHYVQERIDYCSKWMLYLLDKFAKKIVRMEICTEEGDLYDISDLVDGLVGSWG